MTAKQPDQPWIRTPLIRSAALSKASGCQIFLKLENLQPSGSFKSRGVGNFMRCALAAQQSHEEAGAPRRQVHFYISSGGNAGLGCVHAAVTLGCLASVVVPLTTTVYMTNKIRVAGATAVIQYGDSWAEADRYLRDVVVEASRKNGEDPVYVPPFDHPDIWNGNATLIDEILAQFARDFPRSEQDASPFDALVCSVGGGGLFSGIMQGLENQKMDLVRVVAVETKGAESLHQSIEAKQLVTLPRITSMATSLGARTVAKQAFEYGCRSSVTSTVLTDQEAMEGCLRFAEDQRILVELACGVCIAACLDGRLKKLMPDLNENHRVVIVVCGGSNINHEMLTSWVQEPPN